MGRERSDPSEEICFSEEGMPFFLFISICLNVIGGITEFWKSITFYRSNKIGILSTDRSILPGSFRKVSSVA